MFRSSKFFGFKSVMFRNLFQRVERPTGVSWLAISSLKTPVLSVCPQLRQRASDRLGFQVNPVKVPLHVLRIWPLFSLRAP